MMARNYDPFKLVFVVVVVLFVAALFLLPTGQPEHLDSGSIAYDPTLRWGAGGLAGPDYDWPPGDWP